MAEAPLLVKIGADGQVLGRHPLPGVLGAPAWRNAEDEGDSSDVELYRLPRAERAACRAMMAPMSPRPTPRV